MGRQRCYSTPPGTVNRSSTVLKLALRSWISNHLVTHILEIVLQEYLGYTVEFPAVAAGGSNWGKNMAEGVVDAEMEVWQLTLGAADENYRKYVLTQVVDLMGPIGYSGRAGFWVNKAFQEKQPLTEYYKYWRDPSLVKNSDVLKFGEVDIKGFMGDKFPMCTEEHWCPASGPYRGYWIPPQCQARPEDCALLLHPTPGYDPGYFEQLIANHNTSIVVGYSGWDQPALVKRLVEEGKDILFYWWQPEPLLTQVGAKRISFPDTEYGCEAGDTRDPTGPIKCDYREVLCQKVALTALRERAPEAYYAIKNMEMSTAQINEVIATTKEGGGSLDEFEAACAFVKAQERGLTAKMAPACTSRPPVDPQPGDLVFDPGLQQCKEVTAFPESLETCLPELPGTKDRKKTLIKLGRRGWASQALATVVLEIILKDYMRYSVFLVDTTGLPTHNWGPDMENGDYDVDIEQWQAGDNTPQYQDFVLGKEAVANLGTIGYSGRSSVFILPHTLAKEKFADYWRFFTESPASSTDFYRFGDVDLRSLLGADFPQCPRTVAWCGTGRHEGFFVPSTCQNSTERCAVLFAYNPEYDSGFFEQLTQNLGLPVVIAYMGPKLEPFVRAAHANATKDLLFYWFEPSPFPTSVGGVRMNFPDYVYGCTDSYDPSGDPRQGTVACDYPPVELRKLARKQLAREAPEAWHLLEKFALTAGDMREMMKNWTDDRGALDAHNIACAWVRGHLEHVQQNVAPDCLARPKKTIDIRVGDVAFNAALGTCELVTCRANEMLTVAGGVPVCQPCQPGQLPNAEQTLCLDCGEGASPVIQPDGRLECICNGGSRTNAIGECEPCPPGTRADAPVRATRCLNCTEGHFAAEAGATMCQPCVPGTFADKEGAKSCTPCSIGSYQDLGNATSCVSCGNKLVTQVLGADGFRHCVCEEHFYRLDQSSPCLACLPAMTCPLASDVSSFNTWNKAGRRVDRMPPFPMVTPGHMSLASQPLSVYSCAGGERCPGGPPGTCGLFLRSNVPACSRCREKYYWDGHSCVRCTSFETSAVGVAVLPFFVGPAIIALLYRISRDDTDKWGSWQNCTSAIGLLLVNNLQLTSVVAQADLTYSDMLTGSLGPSYFAEDPLSVLRPQCAGLSTYRDTMIMRTAMPAFLLVLVLFTYYLSHAVAKLRGVEGFCEDRTTNIFFSLIFTFFAALSSMAFSTFKCAMNPNGRPTLIADRGIHCYEADWNETLIIAAVALLQILLFGALFFWATYVAPHRFHHLGFRRRWKFLFIKFRPDVWWWSLLFCVRGIMTNVGFIFMQSGFLQIYWVMGVVVAYAFVLVTFAPWRHMPANTMDIFCNFTLAALISLLAFHIVHMSEDTIKGVQSTVDLVAIGLVLLPVAAGGCLVAAAIWSQTAPSAKMARDEEVRDLYGSILEFGEVSEAQVVQVMGLLDDWGVWHIMASLRLACAELIGKGEHAKSRLMDGTVRLRTTAKPGRETEDGEESPPPSPPPSPTVRATTRAGRAGRTTQRATRITTRAARGSLMAMLPATEVRRLQA